MNGMTPSVTSSQPSYPRLPVCGLGSSMEGKRAVKHRDGGRGPRGGT